MTEAGQRYFRQARQAVVDLDEAANDLANLGLAPRGNVRVSAADFEDGPLAGVIAAFSRVHRQIHVDLTVTGRRVNLIEEGFDLAVRAGLLEDSTLVARKVARSELKLYAAPSYLARRARRAGSPTSPGTIACSTVPRKDSSRGDSPARGDPRPCARPEA